MPTAKRQASYQVRCLIGLMFMIGCGANPLPSVPPESNSSASSTVRVAAAADLKFVFPDLIEAFQREYPQVQIEATFGSSGNLFAQLSNQAPFDIFLSADMGYPRKLIEQGQAEQGSEFQYAIGHVGIWVRNDSSLDPQQHGIEVLRAPTVQKIAMANPIHAPYGRAAEAALKSLNMDEAVKDRLVFGENVAQAAQFVESGAADVCLIAQSLAVSPALRETGRFWAFPSDSYPKLEQGGIILNWAHDRAACDKFRQFLISETGREILRRYGFD